MIALIYFSCEDAKNILITEKSEIKKNDDYELRLTVDPDLVYLNSSTKVTANVTRLKKLQNFSNQKTVNASNDKFSFSLKIDPDTVYTGTDANLTLDVTRINNKYNFATAKTVTASNDKFSFTLKIEADTVYTGTDAVVTATVSRLADHSSLSSSYNYDAKFETTDDATISLVNAAGTSSSTRQTVDMEPGSKNSGASFSTTVIYSMSDYNFNTNSFIIAELDGIKIQLPIINVKSPNMNMSVEATGGAGLDILFSSSSSTVPFKIGDKSGSTFSSKALYNMSSNNFTSNNFLYAELDGMRLELPVVNILSTPMKLKMEAVGGTLKGQNFSLASNIVVSVGADSSSTFQALAFFLPDFEFSSSSGYREYQENGHVSATFDGMSVTLPIKMDVPR